MIEVIDEFYVDPDDTTGYTASLVKVGAGVRLDDLYQFGMLTFVIPYIQSFKSFSFFNRSS